MGAIIGDCCRSRQIVDFAFSQHVAQNVRQMGDRGCGGWDPDLQAAAQDLWIPHQARVIGQGALTMEHAPRLSWPTSLPKPARSRQQRCRTRK